MLRAGEGEGLYPPLPYISGMETEEWAEPNSVPTSQLGCQGEGRALARQHACVCNLSNSFIVVESTYHPAHPFKVYNLGHLDGAVR